MWDNIGTSSDDHFKQHAQKAAFERGERLLSTQSINADASSLNSGGDRNGGGSPEAKAFGQADVAVVVDEAEGRKWLSWRLLWLYTGPGWLMSIAYVDPGNIESDLQSGAYTGYQLLWVLFWSTALGLLLQMLAARLGVASGLNLAQACRRGYSRPISLAIWVAIELAIIGSDVQEVIGSAYAFKLLFGWPLWVGCLVTGLDTFTFLGIHYFGVRKLESFFVLLIAIMVAGFGANFVQSKPEWAAIGVGTAVPRLPRYGVVQAVSTVGAVIMPHNIYLHSALVQSRAVDRSSDAAIAVGIKYNSIESGVALLVSFLINASVICVFAKYWFDAGCAGLDGGPFAKEPTWAPGSACDDGQVHGGQCCINIGLAEGGDALQGVLGSKARLFWAIGLLAAGQSSTMCGAFAGQFVMEGFLDIKVAVWKRVAVTRSIALVPAIAVGILAERTSKHVADLLDEWINVEQSVLLPFALLPVLLFCSNEKYMGAFALGPWQRGFTWLCALLVLVINFYLAWSTIDSLLPHSPLVYAVAAVVAALYAAFVVVICIDKQPWYARLRGSMKST